jgi:hypothetical protein
MLGTHLEHAVPALGAVKLTLSSEHCRKERHGQSITFQNVWGFFFYSMGV